MLNLSKLGRVMNKPTMKVMLVAAAMMALMITSALARQSKTYTLQPDDLIRIQVYRTSSIASPDPIVADIPVGKDGNISAPFAGIIRAVGKTTAQLEEDLAREYTKRLQLKNPIVSVTITRYRTVRATVGGSVQRPGTFDMRPGDSLISLLNQGGGIIPDVADLRRATLKHSGSDERIPVDLYAMLNQADTSQNYEVQDGDELMVPQGVNNRINILGAIQQPGSYPYREPMTLSDAIALAHGEITTKTKFSETLIIREKVGEPGEYLRIRANYVRYIRNGDSAQNVILQPGDLVYFPETNTPDLNRISALANVAFIIDRFGGSVFGLHIFSR